MNCPEFIGIVKSGQPIILRRYSKEYVRIAENSLSVVTAHETHICLWLASNRKFKRILRRFSEDIRVGETNYFLRQWQEIGTARAWSSKDNFPGLHEIATFVFMTLIPEYWKIYLEGEEEMVPVIEHDSIHLDNEGYDG
jgi:hypothetical protein